MPHPRPRPPPPPEDRDLAADALYLHSLWRGGPPAPAPAPPPPPVPDPALAPAANQSRSARPNGNRRKRRRLERAAAAETEDAVSDRPLEPSPPASPSPAEPTPPSPGSPTVEYAIYNADHVRAANYRRKANRRKRRRQERHAAETQGAGSPRPLAPSPSASSEARASASPNGWPDAAAASPANPPLSPGSLAQREALRAAEEFFSKDGSDDKEPETEGEEEEAAAEAFFTGMFEWDAALRGHYERRWEEPERRFPCLACAGRKMRRGKRPYLGCVGLVQHARDYGLVSASIPRMRPGAHRALVAVVCRVLGWDIDKLPSILSSLLEPVLATKAQSGAHEAKDVEKEMEDSNTGGDGAANELVPKESAQMKRVGETGPRNCRDNVVGHETIQEEDAVKSRMEEPASIDGEKEITELRGGKESSEKDNANKDDSLSQNDNGIVYEQEIARETTEKENTKDTCSKDTRDNEKQCLKASVQESAAHGGQPCSPLKAFALAHKGKVTSDVDYNREGPPSAYSNATVHSRHTSMAREVHEPEWDPNTKDLDGEIMRVGGGKKHGRYWIGDSRLDTASTPTFSQIRARRTRSAPPICPRPSAAQIQIEQVQAQLWEEMEAKLQKLREERQRMEETMQQRIQEMVQQAIQQQIQQQMGAMLQYMQSVGMPLSPPPAGLFPYPFPGLPPIGVPPPTGTPNQSTGSNNPITPPPYPDT